MNLAASIVPKSKWSPEEEQLRIELAAAYRLIDHFSWSELIWTHTTVRVPGAGMEVSFAEGEYIRTEISVKFRAAGVASELAEGGFALERWWTDAPRRFGLSLAKATG